MLKVSSRDGLMLNKSLEYLMADMNAKDEGKTEEELEAEKRKKEEEE